MARKLKLETMTDEQKVEAGMGMLDAVFGEGWVMLIDLSTFNIAGGNSCVLGQIGVATGTKARYGSMLTALVDMNGPVQDYLFEHFVWPTRLEDHGYEDKEEYKYELIDEGGGFSGAVPNILWVEAIRARQEEFGGEQVVQEALAAYRKKHRIRGTR